MKALALIEHVDRELDLVCLLKLLLKARRGIDLEIANLYADAPLTLARPAPRAVLTPFFYAVEDVVLKDYVEAWPGARFVNLAWEQVFYPTHEAMKAPRDKFTRKKVTHLAWSRSFTDYLARNGVVDDRSRLVGHALYRLYGEPYRRYFGSRDALARAHGLDPAKPWVFVPENYRWAFFTDAKLTKLGRRGLEAEALFEVRGYCRRSLAALMRWCDALARTGEVEVIFRPRPATSLAEIGGFSRGVFGDADPAYRLIKDGSAREWVIASDVVASSYSTVLIEGALAGKRLVRAAPEPTPEGLRYDWCDLVPAAETQDVFLAACLAADAPGDEALRDWAEAMFFPSGDPVDRLVEAVAAEVEAAYAGPAPTAAKNGMPMPAWLRIVAPMLGPVRRHRLFERFVPGYFFNRETHEKDLFGQAEVAARVARWRRTLAAVPAAWTAARPPPAPAAVPLGQRGPV